MPVKRVLSLNSIDYVSNKNDDSGFTSKRCRKNKNLDKKQINSQSRSQPQNFATTSVNTNPVIPVIDVKNNELMSNESSNTAVISTLCEKIKGLEQTVQLLRDQVGFLLSFVGAVGVPLSSDRQLAIADFITESDTATADTVTRGVTASIASEMSDPPVNMNTIILFHLLYLPLLLFHRELTD